MTDDDSSGDDRDHGSARDHGDHGSARDHGDAGSTDGPLRLDHRIAAFREWLHEWLHGLYHGMWEHPANEKIEKEAEDVEDEFLFACFADAFGIPSPVSYYTVELLPYLAEEFEQFERRMWDRETLLERKGQQYHFH